MRRHPSLLLSVAATLAFVVGGCPGDESQPAGSTDDAAVAVEAPKLAVTLLRQGPNFTLAGHLPKGVPDDVVDQLKDRGVTNVELEITEEGELDGVSGALRDALLELAPALLEGQAEFGLDKLSASGVVRSDAELARLTELLEAAAKRAGFKAKLAFTTDSLDAGQGRLLDARGRPAAKLTLTPLGEGEPATTDDRGRVAAGLYRLEDGTHVAIADGRPTWSRPGATAAIRVAGLDFLLDDDVTFVGLSAQNALSFAAHFAADKRRRKKAIFSPRAKNWTEPWRVEDLLAGRAEVKLAVMHADLTRDSAQAFTVLANRELSDHFLIDFDGTIYQTLDVALAAHHAGDFNTRSVAITLNNLSANLVKDPEAPPYPDFPQRAEELARHPRTKSQLTAINGAKVQAYGYTDAQYRALGSLMRTLVGVFPALGAGTPRDHRGNVILHVLADAEAIEGVVAHWHLADDRWDPGPGFDWNRLDAALREGPPAP